MLRRQVSIEDIAREAGVSHATVSRALHDSPLISAEVRRRIQRLAAEMGYTPNAVAQSLKGQRTHTIGLVLTSIADPFYGLVVRGVEEVARAANVDVFLGVSFNNPDQEAAVIESFRRRRVDGMITASSRLGDHVLQKLAAFGLPTVLMNRQAEGKADLLPRVYFDDYAGARLAVGHLLSLGHRAIAYLGASYRPCANALRYRGYVDALSEAGVGIGEGWVQTGSPERRMQADDDVANGQELMPKVLQAGVSAVFCCNDMFAVGALMACRDLGVSVPGEVSLVGFDDIDLAQYVTPPLTTVRQPKLRMGQLAMEMLLRLMAGEQVADELVPPELVVRGSTAGA